MRKLVLPLGLIAAAAAVSAQTQPRIVRANGEATVSVKPDLVRIVVGVVTQGKTAQDAASQNATQSQALQNALQQVLGAGADIQTINYSVTPNYQYPKPGDNTPPVLIGYTVNNSVQVTSADLTNIGKVIDAATQAGANSVGGLTFTLKDPEPVRAQALAQAAKQALAHADAIASGLSVTRGQVVKAEEGTTVRPLTMPTGAAAAPSTPIQTGLVDVSASVTVDVLIS